MLSDRYLEKVHELLERIRTTQGESIGAAAEAAAMALANGGGFFIGPLGHGNEGDLLHRAGGLMALQPFNFSFGVNNPVAECLKDRPRAEGFDADLEAARLAVRASNLRAGDCLIVGSVSGRTPRPVSTAIAAREAGVTVVAITSLEYTARVQSAHSTGLRLCDVADIVVDNCVPYGDACLEVEGLAVPVFPLSGIANIICCWLIVAGVIENLLARGLQPHVYLSVNREDGEAFNAEQLAEYNRLGY
ncbi:MAG: sugar isomerase domain-containing protein [Armatimonadetes bacterium]|nr:sugar isomerase domain-containing protein [Armatimonadota bacterium]